jgi:hypothetical protein
MRTRVLAGIIVLSTACAGHEPTSPLRDVSLSISSGGQSVFEVQQTLQLTASVRDSSGAVLSGQTVSWTSSDSTVASVSTTGLVTGKNLGSVTITATCDGTQATATLTVAPLIAQVFVAAEAEGSLAVGGSMYVYATVVSVSGDTIGGLPITWSSSNISLATVAPFSTVVGTVSATAPGSVSITGTVAGVSGSTTVTTVPLSAVASIVVRPATVTFVAGPLGFSTTTQLSVSATDAEGNTVLSVPVTWTISNPAAATLSTNGLLTPNPAVADGFTATATVTATAAGQDVTVPILVCPEVTTIDVSTGSISLQVGQSVVVSATALDAHGDVDPAPLGSETIFPGGRIVTLQRAGVDSLLMTAVAPGTASFDFREATSGVQSQTIPITVSGSAASYERAAPLHRQ